MARGFFPSAVQRVIGSLAQSILGQVLSHCSSFGFDFLTGLSGRIAGVIASQERGIYEQEGER
jgi:hypothetical protein